MQFSSEVYFTAFIRIITKLPNTEQSSKVKDKTHQSTNRQNQSITGKLGKPNGPDFIHAFPKKWWVESDFTAPNLPLPLRLKGSGCHYNSIFNNAGTKYFNHGRSGPLQGIWLSIIS